MTCFFWITWNYYYSCCFNAMLPYFNFNIALACCIEHPIVYANFDQIDDSYRIKCIFFLPRFPFLAYHDFKQLLLPDSARTFDQSRSIRLWNGKKNIESWFFQESCLKVSRVQNRWFSIILYEGFFVIQDGIRRPSWICGILTFWPV